MDLLDVKSAAPALRIEHAIAALRTLVTVAEDKRVGGVTVAVATNWPSVSLTLARRLVDEVNRFILDKRKSQAAAERQFVESQAAAAEHGLREAEDRLQLFLQQNAVIATPQLGFQRDRLQRDVTVQQQIFSSLVQSREEARIREVRDTPVITILEAPTLPVIGEPRNTVKKALLGAFAGAMLAVFIVYPLQILRTARRSPNSDSREFFHLLHEATPRFLRRRSQSA